MDKARKHRFGKAWMHEHVTDHWVHEAKRLGYRSRAAFKLLEIDAKDKLLRPGSVVVDLGAAPGSWSQVASHKLAGRGRLIAVDVLDMAPLPNVSFVRGDFSESATLEALEALLDGARVDLVLSDMAPNISGVGAVDQARMLHLAELALDFSRTWLGSDGSLLLKTFQGQGFEEIQRAMRETFGKVSVRKPKASRDRSSEVYLLGKSPASAPARIRLE